MADIAPALFADVQKAFQQNVERNQTIKRVNNRIRDGTATTKDAHLYAEALGEDLAEAFRETIKPGTLPDDRMYYNIAARVVEPMMEKNFTSSQAKAGEIQKLIFEEAGIGINPVKAKYPKERVKGLIDKITEAETLEEILRWLDEPVVNTTISFYDDWLISNAEWEKDAGMEPKIKRELGSAEIRMARKRAYAVPCRWCQSIAGQYTYGDQPDDFFQRHESCRCVITLDRPGSNRRAGGWGKMVWQASRAVLDQRKAAGL